MKREIIQKPLIFLILKIFLHKHRVQVVKLIYLFTILNQFFKVFHLFYKQAIYQAIYWKLPVVGSHTS